MNKRLLTARLTVLLLSITLGVLAYDEAKQGQGVRTAGQGQTTRAAEAGQIGQTTGGKEIYGLQDKQRQQAGETAAVGRQASSTAAAWDTYGGRLGRSEYTAAAASGGEYAQRLGNRKEYEQGAMGFKQQAGGPVKTQAVFRVLPGGTAGHFSSLAYAVPIGTFTITAYTAGPESTGKRPGDKEYGITASGAHVQEGVTIAADPKVLPIGSRVYIVGVGVRVVHDTGSAIKGRKLDLFIPDLDEANAWGLQHRKVYLLKKGTGDL